MAAAVGVGAGHAENRQVIGLGGAGGERDFLRLGADQRRHLRARGFHVSRRAHPGQIMGGGGCVAKLAWPGESSKHGLRHDGIDWRRGRVVEIHGRIVGHRD